ncbi:MAG: tripartite tricarboxylate transporter family receptor [Hyphomicrobiales bacterium]|nr:tripartite tricarboxylate transporter family receptor [Hyphomicrobiales bacterium]
MTRTILLALAWACAAAPAAAADFYKDKVVSIVTSTGPGGTYDTMARLFSRHLGKHIPGRPSFIIRNMPGGGNVIATNHMYNIAPKDGLTIATVHNAMPLNQVLGGTGVAYESDKFIWLGSTGPENSVIVVRSESGFTKLEDARQNEINLGSTGAGSGLTLLPLAMNRVLGTRFKIIMGYKSSEELNLALDRGEVQARAFSYSSIISQHPDWIAKKKFNFIAQIGTKRLHDLPDVPLITELAKTDDELGVLRLISSPPGLGQPYLAPPGTPADRVAILREGLAKTMRDEAFVKEAAALTLDVDPMSAEEVTEIVRSVVHASPEVVQKTRALLGEGGGLVR